jgi:hypothetical protein
MGLAGGGVCRGLGGMVGVGKRQSAAAGRARQKTLAVRPGAGACYGSCPRIAAARRGSLGWGPWGVSAAASDARRTLSVSICAMVSFSSTFSPACFRTAGARERRGRGARRRQLSRNNPPPSARPPARIARPLPPGQVGLCAVAPGSSGGDGAPALMLPSLIESPSGGTTTAVLNTAPHAGLPPASRARRVAKRAVNMEAEAAEGKGRCKSPETCEQGCGARGARSW